MSNFGDVRSAVQANDEAALKVALLDYNDKMPAEEVIAYIRKAWGWCPATQWNEKPRLSSIMIDEPWLSAAVKVGGVDVGLGVISHPWVKIQEWIMPHRYEAAALLPQWLEMQRIAATNPFLMSGWLRILPLWQRIIEKYEACIGDPDTVDYGRGGTVTQLGNLVGSTYSLMARFPHDETIPYIDVMVLHPGAWESCRPRLYRIAPLRAEMEYMLARQVKP